MKKLSLLNMINLVLLSSFISTSIYGMNASTVRAQKLVEFNRALYIRSLMSQTTPKLPFIALSNGKAHYKIKPIEDGLVNPYLFSADRNQLEISGDAAVELIDRLERKFRKENIFYRPDNDRPGVFDVVVDVKISAENLVAEMSKEPTE